MGTRDRLHEIKTVDEVDAFLSQYPTCAIFKAGGCHKTMQGFTYVEEALNPRESLHLAAVRVIENRPASNYIAQLTGITHESPQFILMIDGKPVYDVDNWNITLDDLKQALNTFLGVAIGDDLGLQMVNLEKVAPYIDLLRNFVSGEMNEEEFSESWLKTFQQDSSLRTSKEFTLLNSLFGDVDEALSFGSPPCSVHLKQRSFELLNKLKS